MSEPLTNEDIDLILTSLEYTRRAVDESPDRDYEQKLQQLQQIAAVKQKVRALKDSLLKKNDRPDEIEQNAD